MRRTMQSGTWAVGQRPSEGSGAPSGLREPGVWLVGLDAWVIQDGNYGDFRVGDEREFAVEFCVQGPLQEAQRTHRRTEHLRDDTYLVAGEVLTVTDDRQWWVLGLDGLTVYDNRVPPPAAEQGRVVEGTVQLGIDPFFYLESGGAGSGLPALIYPWRIRRIFIQAAPYIEVSPRFYARDLSAWSWQPVDATEAWTDDGGQASYLFECQLLSPTPRFPR